MYGIPIFLGWQIILSWCYDKHLNLGSCKHNKWQFGFNHFHLFHCSDCTFTTIKCIYLANFGILFGTLNHFCPVICVGFKWANNVYSYKWTNICKNILLYIYWMHQDREPNSPLEIFCTFSNTPQFHKFDFPFDCTQ